jgi:hypothetical protein
MAKVFSMFHCFNGFKAELKGYGVVEHDSKFGDLAFINQQIDQLPITMQKEVKARYSEIYVELCEKDQQNARFRSNTWLRRVVEKNKPKNDDSLPF